MQHAKERWQEREHDRGVQSGRVTLLESVTRHDAWASGNTHTQPQVGGWPPTNVPLSGGERASERSAINLHLIAFARAAPPACAARSPRTRRLVVSFTTALLFVAR